MPEVVEPEDHPTESTAVQAEEVAAPVVETVRSVKDFAALMVEATRGGNRRWFRGTRDCTYELVPSLYRHPRIKGTDIPKLYVANFTLLNSPLNQSGKKYAVIDGKQRLLALFGFFTGEYTLPRTFTYYDNPSFELGGLAYKDLVNNYPRVARRFDNYPLTVVHVVTDDEAKINELFLRLNASKPLTGAEIRNAMLGEVPQVIRELVGHPFWNRIKFNTLRGQDKNTAAKLLLIEHIGTFVDTKKTQLDALVRAANESAELAARAAGGVDSIADDEAIERSTEEALPESVDEAETLITEDLVDKAEETEDPDFRRSARRVQAQLDKMASIFIDKDPLLVQQAQIPVIYWLVREIEPSRLPKVRPFLQKFD